jgi:release factor glutamine methyltransferase
MSAPNSKTMTIGDALRFARNDGIDRLDAQLLLAHFLERPRTWLVTHEDVALSPERISGLTLALARRASGEPLAYVLGTKEFYGLELQVNADVLVPRPDTEVLVGWAIELLSDATQFPSLPRVVDLGTGSGAIALAVKQARPETDMLATDVSDRALTVARDNARRLGAEIRFLSSSWWSGLDGKRFHLALSNPPYINAADPHLDALRFEPQLALTPGIDALGALRQIASGSLQHVEPGGWLLLEHGHDQAAAVRHMLGENGGRFVQTRRDLGSHERCSGAKF